MLGSFSNFTRRFALPAVLGVACAPRAGFPSGCRASEFTDPATLAPITREFEGMRVPEGTMCGLRVRGWREQSHGVFVSRTSNGFLVSVVTGEDAVDAHTYTAPLGGFIGAKIGAVCATTLASRARCTHLGRDGTYYLLAMPGRAPAPADALTWSPKPGTRAGVVVDMFDALRAYASAPRDVEVAAGHTAYRAVENAYATLVQK